MIIHNTPQFLGQAAGEAQGASGGVGEGQTPGVQKHPVKAVDLNAAVESVAY